MALALRQVQMGAQMLDVNAGGLAGRDESTDLVWLVQVVQDVVDVPLVLDSGDPEVVHAALDVYRGPRPILSSITGVTGQAGGLLASARQRSCGIVALCLNDQGFPMTVEGRVSIAGHLISQAEAAGIPREDIYVDRVILAVGVNDRAGLIALGTILAVRERFPGVHVLCAVSNVSFGLPARRLLNRTFAAMLVACGADAFIVDVRDRALRALLLSAQMLAGQDRFCRRYLKAYRKGELE